MEISDQPQRELISGCKACINWLSKMFTNMPNHTINLASTASVFVYITGGFHSTEKRTPMVRCAGWRTTLQQPLCLRPSRRRGCDPPPRQAGADGTECLCSPASGSGGGRAELRGKKRHVSIDYRGQILPCTQHFQRDGVLKLRVISLVSSRELNRWIN